MVTSKNYNRDPAAPLKQFVLFTALNFISGIAPAIPGVMPYSFTLIYNTLLGAKFYEFNNQYNFHNPSLYGVVAGQILATIFNRYSSTEMTTEEEVKIVDDKKANTDLGDAFGGSAPEFKLENTDTIYSNTTCPLITGDTCGLFDNATIPELA